MRGRGGTRARRSSAGREAGEPCETDELCEADEPCIHSFGHAEKFVVVGARSAYTSRRTGASGTRCGESGDRVVRMCEVRHAASVTGMRTVLSVKWTRYGEVDHLHADSANDCAQHRELIAAVRGSRKQGAHVGGGPRRVAGVKMRL